MKNNKGLSPTEFIMAITLMSVMVSLIMPVLYEHVGTAQKAVCQYNRSQYIKSFNAFTPLDTEGYTLEDAIDSNTCPDDLINDLDGLTCPRGGTFYVDEDGEIRCTVCDDNEEPAGGGPTTLIAGDTLYDYVQLQNWETLCQTTSELPWGGVQLNKGTVYVVDGVTYVVEYKAYLSNSAAKEYMDNPAALSFMQPFGPDNTIESSAYNKTVGWTPLLMNGMVCEKNGKAYVYLGSDNTKWESLPPNGYWVELK